MWGNRSGVGRWENGQEEDLSMDHRLVFAPARPTACTFAVAAATTMLTALIGSAAFAQAPPAPTSFATSWRAQVCYRLGRQHRRVG
jgi:hypothetical protein